MPPGDPVDITLEILGVRAGVRVDDPVVGRVIEELWEPFLAGSARSATPLHVRGSVGADFVLERDDQILDVTTDPWQMLLRLKTEATIVVLSELPDLVVVHSAAVEESSGGALLLVGPAGAGKTTLSADLAMRGFPFMGDDLIAIDPVTRRVLPLPRPPAFKGTVHSQSDLSDRWRPPDWLTVDSGPFMAPATSLGPIADRPVPIGRLVFPHYMPESAGSTRRLSSAEAAAVMGEQTHSLDERGLSVVLAICREVGAMEVEYASTEQFLEVLT